MKPAENCSTLPLAQLPPVWWGRRQSPILTPGWKAPHHLCAGPLLLLQDPRELFLLCSPSSLGREEQEGRKGWREKGEKVERMDRQKQGRKRGRDSQQSTLQIKHSHFQKIEWNKDRVIMNIVSFKTLSLFTLSSTLWSVPWILHPRSFNIRIFLIITNIIY